MAEFISIANSNDTVQFMKGKGMLYIYSRRKTCQTWFNTPSCCTTC